MENKSDSAKNPIKIQDNTFRDGHQSLLATRMRTEDMLPIAEKMDSVGFWAMEVSGGAAFDVPHRFLGEDPFERIKILKSHIRKTPFSMLVRGQNLVGYRIYPDDVVKLCIDKHAEAGIDIFKTFDALNDFRNLESVAKAVKANGKHFEGTICYSLSQRHLGGDIYNLEYYVKKAKELEDMGSDTLSIKDMSGIISPLDANKLVTALKKAVKIPIHLHTHYTSGMGSMAYLEAIKAGVDIIDTCLAPFAMRTAPPAIEPIVATLYGTSRDPGFDINLLLELGDYIETIAPKYRDFLAKHKMAVIDTGVLVHQVPGGMLSNLFTQLREAKALDRLPEVYKEIAITRRELGMPPLVTPTSQIVGVQSLLNVLFGRYEKVINETKHLVYGLYGKTPIPVDPDVQKKVLKGYQLGETPVTGRAADYVEPELEEAKKKIGDLARDDYDFATYALFPETGRQFLKWKYGLEKWPPQLKAKTLDDIRLEDEAMTAAIEQVCNTM